MKKIKIFLLIFISYLLFFNRLAYAQTPTVQTIDSSSLNTAIGANCGFANIDGSDKCCTNNNVSEDKMREEAKKRITVGSGLIDSLPQSGITNDFGLGNFVGKKCFLGDPINDASGCTCKTVEKPTPIAALETICNQYYTNAKKPLEIQNELQGCIACAKGGGILTGIGCVPINLGNFVSNFVLGAGIGLGGIFSLLCIIYSSFMMQTSQGNPEKIKKAQENLTACIIGLILIIFSVFILRLIGVTILKIPGFEG